MTLPEVLLWRELRGRRGGVKLRRQHPVGPYVIDFYCPETKTGFEIDGHSHDTGDRAESDRRRDAFLAEQGITIVRIAASMVLRDVLQVAEGIAARCLADRG